jgi:putative DNA primase/helicase
MDDPLPPELDELIAPYRAAERPTGNASAGGVQSPHEFTLDPAAPLTTAKLFIEHHYTATGLRTLHHHGGAFYEWNGRCYELADTKAVRAEVYAFLDTASRRDSKGNLVPFQPNMARVSNVMDALHAVANVPAALRMPAWIAEPADGPPAREIVACANGLLHLQSGALLSLTPAFFSLNALSFAFNHEAPAPAQWLQFLGSLWADDSEAIETLQEWFGYCLVSDTRQQKIMLQVGPKRSGKGTIGRVLTALLGQTNVCAPTLASLGQNFGLAPLIGKQLAMIADARLSSRADQHAIAERLLSISGEDGITVDRKFLEPWTGTLSARFMIMTNELPRIADASGALASRFIVLTLRRSFIGSEDHGLTDRLLAELPAILNWAIEGWHRLQQRGHFRQPASSADAIQELEDLGSPIGAFLRERCEVAPGLTVSCALLFDHWRVWCEGQGRDHTGTAPSFGRDLRAAVPGLASVNRRISSDERERHYEGIGMRADIPLGVKVRAEAASEGRNWNA